MNISEFIFNNFGLCFLAILIWNVCAGYYMWRQRQKKGLVFPSPTDADMVFSEVKASGASARSIFTRLGGANRCLIVMLNHNTLAITTPFPFNLFNQQFDLDHIVPLENIVSVEQKAAVTRVVYTHDDGSKKELSLYLKKPEQFMEAISKN